MAGARGPVRVVVVCLSDEDHQAEELKKAAAPIPVHFYDGKTKPCTPIVHIYQRALDEIHADFFVFAHQDVRGNIPQWVQNGLDVMGHADVLGAIGFRPGLPTLWRDAEVPTVVSTCDECCFGFYQQSHYEFDLKLQWTNYSQDICLQAAHHSGNAIVVPNSIGHAQHRHGPWFIKSGIYAKEKAHVCSKWRPILEQHAKEMCRFSPPSAFSCRIPEASRCAAPEHPLNPERRT